MWANIGMLLIQLSILNAFVITSRMEVRFNANKINSNIPEVITFPVHMEQWDSGELTWDVTDNCTTTNGILVTVPEINDAVIPLVVMPNGATIALLMMD